MLVHHELKGRSILIYSCVRACYRSNLVKCGAFHPRPINRNCKEQKADEEVVVNLHKHADITRTQKLSHEWRQLRARSRRWTTRGHRPEAQQVLAAEGLTIWKKT